MAAPSQSPADSWDLRLYVAGQTAKSMTALANLKKICETHLQGKYHIEVIDLQKHPELAREHQIVAIPTLVRKLPEPLRKIIGDLSNTERALDDGAEVDRLAARMSWSDGGPSSDASLTSTISATLPNWTMSRALIGVSWCGVTRVPLT